MNRTHTRTLATLALLCAMEIVLARFCVIWITNSIKITPTLLGVMAGLLRPLVWKRLTLPRLLLVTGPGFVLGSMFWTTWWLSTLYGTPLPALLAVRVPLYCVIAVLDTLVLFFLCRSGVFRRLGLWPEQA